MAYIFYNEVITLDVTTKKPRLGLTGSERRRDNMKPLALPGRLDALSYRRYLNLVIWV